MRKINSNFRAGLRTIKMAIAVMLAMIIVDAYGTTVKLVFATQERDVVTNYHIAQILKLRRELLEALRE